MKPPDSENLLQDNPPFGPMLLLSRCFDRKMPNIHFLLTMNRKVCPYWNKWNGNCSVAPCHYEARTTTAPNNAKRRLTEPYFYEGVFMVSYVSSDMKDGEFAGLEGWMFPWNTWMRW